MGSFSATCAASDLAIPGGTPIRVFLLNQNPYGEGWDIRTPPIRAEYDDYGGIENVHGDDAALANLWREALEIDLVERGVGDNQCHDVATRRGMSFEALCGALQEKRVLVRQDAKHFWMPSHDAGPTESALNEERKRRSPSRSHIPTMAGVEADLGAELVAKLDIDAPIGNVVRVRVAGFGNAGDLLQRAQAKLSSFATVITAGKHEAGLLVFSAPGDDRSYAGPVWEARGDEDRHLPVAWAFVRDDVWQGFLSAKRPSDYGPGTLVAWRETIKEAWDAMQSILARGITAERPAHFTDLTSFPRYSLPFKSVPGVIGIAEHMALVALAKASPDRMLDALAELSHVSSFIRGARRSWAPMNALSGAQFPEWAEHLRYLSIVKRVATAEKQKG